jgi:hypothetical protein
MDIQGREFKTRKVAKSKTVLKLVCLLNDIGELFIKWIWTGIYNSNKLFICGN